MLSLLLAGALQSQLWFNIKTQGAESTVQAYAQTTQNCLCNYKIRIAKMGKSGRNTTSQQQESHFRANQPEVLSSMRFTLLPTDKVTISVELYSDNLLLSRTSTTLPQQ
ncbi:MAG: curli-like amyloid fiber formation chaperone CsgH [Plesiomonas sp.]|uniref:curli-like amyloid fiber formation chaperone CsgH n=1 Tax=Plesiomonas sp. TaxID=2486279 RepID=UPI003F33F443